MLALELHAITCLLRPASAELPTHRLAEGVLCKAAQVIMAGDAPTSLVCVCRKCESITAGGAPASLKAEQGSAGGGLRGMDVMARVPGQPRVVDLPDQGVPVQPARYDGGRGGLPPHA